MTPSAEPTSQRAEVATHLVPANLLADGETVILALKPSNWFVLIVSVPVLASVLVVAAAAYVVNRYHPATPEQVVFSFAAAAGVARLAVGCWQWLGRTYVLTNRRVVCVRGLVRIQVAAAALTDLRAAVLAPSLFERPVGVATIYCFAGSGDEDPDPSKLSADAAAVRWNTIAHPGEVQDILNEAITRARRSQANSRAAPGQP